MTPADLRARRILAGLTQRELAQLLSVDIRQVRRWELGETPIRPVIATAIDAVLGGQS